MNGNLKGLLIKHNIKVIHHGEIINGIGLKEKCTLAQECLLFFIVKKHKSVKLVIHQEINIIGFAFIMLIFVVEIQVVKVVIHLNKQSG